MKRYIIFLVTIFCMFSMNAQNPLWEKVSEYEKQSLPQSALEVVNKIQQEAIRNNDSPEVIKSWIFKIKYETAIDQDKLPGIIKEIESYNSSNKNKVEQAFLYYVLAKLYSDYYRKDSYSINQRTSVAGYVPEDIREWSGNNFSDRILEYVKLSVAPAKELQDTDVLKYEAVLLDGESSRELRPTAYDFLIYQGIDLLNASRFEENFSDEIKKMYADLNTFREKENNPQALLALQLDFAEYMYNQSSSDTRDKDYLEMLNALAMRFAGKDFSIEILYKLANYYFNQRRYSINNDADEDSANENIRKAYEICLGGIAEYPNYKRISILQNLLNQITLSTVEIRTDNVVYPGQDLELKISSKNVKQLFIEIYKIKVPVSDYLNDWSRQGAYKKHGELTEKREVDLLNQYPYLSEDTTIYISMKELGSYEYLIYSENRENNPANRQFSVSKLACVSRGLKNQREYLVVDRLSGKPIEGAQINFYERLSNKYRKLGTTAKTNGLGLATGSDDSNISAFNVSYENDTSLILSSTPWISSYRQEETSTVLSIFMDRGIYRPGQTIFFKGILYTSNSEKQEIIPNKKCQITLYDANYKEISAKDFVTNEFGTISGEFTIPQGILNGYFTLQSDIGDAHYSFPVEEYKRPTFDITFKENNKTYKFGDKVSMEGEVKSFSGIILQNTEVKYRVTQRNYWGRYASANQIAEGSVFTDDNGNFEIKFLAEKLLRDRNINPVFYNYTIEATVTNTNGETQSSSATINIGDRSAYLTFSGLSSIIMKEDLPKVKILAANLSNNPVSISGKYEIYTLIGEKKLMETFDSSDWKTGKSVLSGDFTSGEYLSLDQLKKLDSGAYRIIAKAKDDQGREIEAQQDFTLTSSKDKRPPVPVYEWVLTPKTTCEVGEKAEIIYGSSAKNVYVLYELFKNQEKLSSTRFELNDENRKIEIPFLDSYGDGITAIFTFIKEKKVYTKNITIYRKQPDKKLSLKMEVFRDRLIPGQSEEWKISVKDVAQNPVLAELLAGMYDASLDKISQNNWSFNPIRSIYLNPPRFNSGNSFGTSSGSLTRWLDSSNVSPLLFDSFNWFGWSIYSSMLRTTGAVQIRGMAKAGGVLDEMVVSEVNMAVAYGEENKIRESDSSVPSPQLKETVQFTPPVIIEEQQAVQIRQNFNETAFFYPQLKTNSDGETLISFTLPESNTTWKFMALAHTKDLLFGQLTEEIISQKKLMITPNIPRFIREGDNMSISTNISNLSENSVSGKISIEFFDPNSEKTTIVVSDNSKNFALEPGKTVGVTWHFDVPSGLDMTAVKIVAVSEEFSDGEQHLIPVLPNRMLVTESLPLNILGGESKSFTFDKLANPNSSTLENYRLTLEFSSNPTWYAVQALPTMNNPQNDDVISWFAAFYSNILAYDIANSTPKIKQMIDIWTKQGNDKETLLSNLEKNQELKAILLEETPWVLQAENETEQKQRLALLFDLNRISYQNSQALDKLKSLQTSEGGWAWFKGMYANVSITQWLLYGMGELENLKAAKFDDDIKQMQQKAIEFIDQKFYEYFERLKENNKKWKEKQTISTYEIEYLLVRSLYLDIPIEKTKEASDFYLNILKKYWTKNTTIYDRAIASMVLNRNGETKTAQAILKSLREHASKKSDLGMFWANNNTHSFMFQSATAVHTFVMEAFQELGASSEEMDQMKLWLLKQKQVQEWESVPATVNAVNILLKTGANWLESEGKVSIALGNKQIDTTKGEAGTGYIKESFDKNSFTSEMANVKISKEDKGPAWGALYWQYFEDLDKITFAKTELNVEKSLFVEKVVQGGKELVPVNETNPIKVGDKVTVRLTVRTDRDMEYVMLKDMRASCFEPVDQRSGIQWAQRVIYYQSPKDASMNFYFNNLPKGTYVFEYSLYATSPGDYSNGISTIQCLYAPEFVSHTSGGRVVVIGN